MSLHKDRFKRMYWHSRRGMLELDLILVPFAQNHLAELPEKEIDLYEMLLEEEDPNLFSWLIGKEAPPTEKLKVIIAIVLEKSGAVVKS